LDNTSLIKNIEIEKLKFRRDFLRVARSGNKWVSPSMVVQGKWRCENPVKLANEDKKIFVGFTVSKRVGNSVIRNRVRRRLKAAARGALMAEGALGKEFVIIGRNKALNYPFKSIINDLKWSVRKLDEYLKKKPRE